MAFAYGVCRGTGPEFEKYGRQSIERFLEPGAHLFVLEGQTSMFSAYNRLLELAAAVDCEGIVLLHDDVELTHDPATAARETFERHPQVALIGTVGGSDTVSLAWWRELAYRRGVILDYKKLHAHGAEFCLVDAADDVILVASRWTVDNVRFPNGRYTGFEGLGVILSFIVRDAGRRVAVQDLGDVMHHNINIGFNGLTWWRRNDLRFTMDFFDLRPSTKLRFRLFDTLTPILPAYTSLRRWMARHVPWAIHLTSDTRGESQDPVVNDFINRWYAVSDELRGRRRVASLVDDFD